MRVAAFAAMAGAVASILGAGSSLSADKRTDFTNAPTWAAAPNWKDVWAVWPAAAKAAGTEGHARVDCAVASDGRLTDCRLIEEFPANMGFGEAALGLVPQFKRHTEPVEGQPVPARVVLGFGWWKPADRDNTAVRVREPTAAEMKAVWPKELLRQNKIGGAILSCFVDGQGLLRDCWIFDETLPRSGAGEAALALAPFYRFKPALSAGRPSRIRQQVAINFFPAEAQDDWDTPPSLFSGVNVADLVSVWPAASNGDPGWAMLGCKLSRQGHLEECMVLIEHPPAKGFGAAALLIAPTLRYKPATLRGVAVESHVHQRINWEGMGVTLTRGRRMVADPPWTAAPSISDVAAAYPKDALSKALSGQTVMQCRLDQGGRLKGCKIVSQDPEGAGFGKAALDLSVFFQAPPAPPSNLGLYDNLVVDVSVRFTPPNEVRTRIISKPDWTTTLRADVVQEVFPAKAAGAGLTTGRAVMDCIADAKGRLTNCKVTSEDPAGMGFGESALRVAEVMTVNPWTNAGEPVEGAHIVFPIRLNRQESEPLPPPSLSEPAAPG